MLVREHARDTVLDEPPTELVQEGRKLVPLRRFQRERLLDRERLVGEVRIRRHQYQLRLAFGQVV